MQHTDQGCDPAPGLPAAASRPRVILGVLLGCGTAPLGLLYLLVTGVLLGPLLLRPRTRTPALAALTAGARLLTGLERRRRENFFGDRFPPGHQASGRQILNYLAARTFAGLLCGVVVALLAFGAVLAGILATGVIRGGLDLPALLGQVAIGGVLLFLDLQGLWSLADLDTRLARTCFGLSREELLQRRIDELSLSRAAVLRAVDTERRRIERDLHDGVQQRLVALAMLLGRARRGRTPEQADALLRQAHQEAQDVLNELREVAWRVYPTALDGLGLQEALNGVIERCAIPVDMEYGPTGPLPQLVETAAYFVVSEAVTNAAKHAAATRISIRVVHNGPTVTVRIQDNGIGGANPTGTGLAGLRGRVSALDGLLNLDSPKGGPTTVTAELPCA
ncbi:sensor histidine kinase [Streptomyces boluensis]|uniref:sensor histidine kinase n=1 Tax=Streptomyces boluensis TaxID=1775135 RepID=UPI0028AD082D|nr:sensor histidine kinase [Streptomyces boluensis]